MRNESRRERGRIPLPWFWIGITQRERSHIHLIVDADAAFSAALMSIVRPDAEIFLGPADTVDRAGSRRRHGQR